MKLNFLNMDSNKMVISEFYQNDRVGKYDYDTVYQRDKVWSEEKKSFLIDSILKNYPIPPVFLRMKIDSDTGITKYEVIDGKQRLTTIRGFIEGEIALPDDFGGDDLGIQELNGATFKDLEGEFDKYKKQFWSYRIPVIFIETDDTKLVKNVFDRLNRNGEPLVPQELRHAKYGGSKFYNIIQELTVQHAWKGIFDKILETERKEDEEFVSELVFYVLEEKLTAYTKETLDNLYEKWEKKDVSAGIELFKNTSSYIEKYKLDYDSLKIEKVSHLYAIWVVSFLAYTQKVDNTVVSEALEDFYLTYIKDKSIYEMAEYKKSMSSNTKGTASRSRRIKAVIDFINRTKNTNIQFIQKSEELM